MECNPAALGKTLGYGVFQSAFHRGMECNQSVAGGQSERRWLSVRFSSRHGVQRSRSFANQMVGRFQSAFHRGMECNHSDLFAYRCTHNLSVRFSSRHGVQQEAGQILIVAMRAFSPLFIAAWSATRSRANTHRRDESFQSAFHRGMECNIL